ncbi:MAG TPA: SDR family NAD(P)-dependent oxidoreductase [Anaerolineae bacterium]|nr:SDR family NAD(P)-dependent oxidoreductase [Anaerolineae bacterium]
MPLTDKVAIVIGATGQLGPAVAKAFAHSGARLVLVSTNHERLALLFNELGFRESRVMTHVANAMDEAAMQDLADAVTVRFGRADILLHLAGGYRGGSLRDTQGDIWEYLLNLNLRTAVNSMRAFLPLLTANNWGRIITISSGITQAPPSNVAAYVTAKAALEAMTVAVAQEVKDKNITANVVLIRSLDTPAERARQPERKTGWVRPEDVAATLLFLCSDEGGAITGARIPVFGGS